jgi:hypothetical protein
MSQHDLTRQLESFQISSEEERVVQQLSKTNLEPTMNTSIFSIPKASQASAQAPQAPQQQLPPTLPQHANQEDDANDWNTANASWASNNTVQTQNDDSEGWGTGPPSYTSIIQGTYFGFNSIITPSAVTDNSNPVQLHDTQAFSRFKNKPVSFTSAIHKSNDTSSSMQQ